MGKFKLLIVGVFLLIASSSAYAQRDMILTQAGEELRCRIIDETPVKFAFAYLKNGKPYRSEIFKNLVKSFKYNYYETDLPNAKKLPKAMYQVVGSTNSEVPKTLKTNEKSNSESQTPNSSGQVGSKRKSIDRTLDEDKELTTIDGAEEEKNVPVTTDTPDISETELPNITINQKNKFRVGIKGGIGNRLDNNLQTTNSFDLYQEQLLRGWTLGADLAYFPNDLLGFGIVFTDFKSRNSNDEILYRNEFTGSEQIGSVTNNRSVKFIGPALFLRKKLDYKTYVVLGLSPGYNSYVDKGSYDGVDYTFKGGGFGAASTLGIDFLLGNDIIGRDIILSFEAGYNYGSINSLDYGDARGVVDLATPIDLSRLDFTVGFRFIRFPKYFRLTSY